jgi:4-coumarate--CoA ligase
MNLPSAVIVRKNGFEDLTEHEIQSKVAEKFPFYKHLYGGVYFVNDIPTTPNGKVLRRIVREIAMTKFHERYKQH